MNSLISMTLDVNVHQATLHSEQRKVASHFPNDILLIWNDCLLVDLNLCHSGMSFALWTKYFYQWYNYSQQMKREN